MRNFPAIVNNVSGFINPFSTTKTGSLTQQPVFPLWETPNVNRYVDDFQPRAQLRKKYVPENIKPSNIDTIQDF